ncbi:N-acetylmuramoyl-L-alanine amidase [Streptomyces sp. NPDC003374]
MSPTKAHARRKLVSRRRTWLAIGATLLSGTGVATAAIASSTDQSGDGTETTRPVRAQTVALAGSSTAKRTLPRTDTQTFSLLGVSWKAPRKNFDGTAQIRTRDADSGSWSDWRDLDFDTVAPETDEGRTSHARGASEPLWVGPSDAIEARVVADGKQSAVPDGLRLDLIDPGTTSRAGKSKGGTKPGKQPTVTDIPSTASAQQSAPVESATATAPSTADETAPDPSATPQDTVTTSASASAPDFGDATPESPVPTATDETTTTPAPSPTDGATAQPTPIEPTDTSTPTGPLAPAITPRADWGADESLVKDPPEYLDKVEALFVHHTAGTNDYTCADSPAIIRAIFAYHVQANGWNDVGYNFFVDKCGTLFEGRAGGIDQRVRGAHTYGFNGVSSGIALLGDYENGATPTAAAQQAIADLAAWKLGLDGVDPHAQTTLTAAGDTGVYKTGEHATLNTISGHRDGYATLCPGRTLYAALPDIRTLAAASRYTSTEGTS